MLTASLVVFWVDERLKYKDICPGGVKVPTRELGNLWRPIEITNNDKVSISYEQYIFKNTLQIF